MERLAPQRRHLQRYSFGLFACIRHQACGEDNNRSTHNYTALMTTLVTKKWMSRTQRPSTDGSRVDADHSPAAE